MPFNADTLIGQTVGGYHLDRMLGTGGAGIVYLAHVPDQQVALKLLVPPGQMTAAEQEEFRKRFLREAATLTRLNHPHILSVRSVDEDTASGFVYMVMDYLSGGTLIDRLNQGPLPLPQVRDYVAQIADALDYAHHFNIVHRDLKPANVLLDEQGQVYLADFGIAKLLDANTTTITNVNQAIGTPGYMAPEQLTNELVSPATDVYGLGALTYQMVTGQVPFDAPSLLSLLRQVTLDEPPPPHTLRPDLPVPAEQVILRALAKDPGARFASAGAFAQAFARGLEGKHITPSPRTLLAQPELVAGGFLQQDDAPLAVSGANQQITNAWPIDQPPPDKRRRGMLIAALLLALGVIVVLIFLLPGMLSAQRKQNDIVRSNPTATLAPETITPIAQTASPVPTSTKVPAIATSTPVPVIVPPTQVPTATPVPAPPDINGTTWVGVGKDVFTSGSSNADCYSISFNEIIQQGQVQFLEGSFSWTQPCNGSSGSADERGGYDSSSRTFTLSGHPDGCSNMTGGPDGIDFTLKYQSSSTMLGTLRDSCNGYTVTNVTFTKQ